MAPWEASWVLPQYMKHIIVIQASNTTSRDIPGNRCSNQHSSVNVRSSVIHNDRNSTNVHYLVDEQQKPCGIHTMKYYSAITRNEAPTRAPARMDAEDTMLSEESHRPHDSIYMKCPGQVTAERQKADERWPGVGRGVNGERLLHGHTLSLGVVQMLWNW